jgi:hypothetical protein
MTLTLSIGLPIAMIAVNSPCHTTVSQPHRRDVLDRDRYPQAVR